MTIKEYKDPFSNKNARESGVSCQTGMLKRQLVSRPYRPI